MCWQRPACWFYVKLVATFGRLHTPSSIGTEHSKGFLPSGIIPKLSAVASRKVTDLILSVQENFMDGRKAVKISEFFNLIVTTVDSIHPVNV
jgi:hypothetical protein